MITTNCEACCFFKQDAQGKGCIAQQLCITHDNKVLAPGYCRICRSHNWRQKQNITDNSELYRTIILENALCCDLVIIFDETLNTIDDLRRTLSNNWYCGVVQKIIIADVTGFGDRKNIALQCMKEKKEQKDKKLASDLTEPPIVVDSSVERETSEYRAQTIKRLSKMITSSFFMVIPAGHLLNNINALTKLIQDVPSRVIHWSFPFQIGGTTILYDQSNYGLYLTHPYKSIVRDPNTNSFMQRLKKEELEIDMKLSWLCSDCWLI